MSKFNLEKVDLSRGASFNLTKVQEIKDIRINLNWSSQQPKSGFFSKIFGGGNVDLDLGCLFEMADGGIGAVQALGDCFGSFDRDPYIRLLDDDRTGANTEGETILINAKHWDEIKRIVVFAFIYEGAANWDATNGVVTIFTESDESDVAVRLSSGRNDRRLCGIATIENVGGQVKITNVEEYFKDQEELDRAFSIGLNWRTGSK